MTRHPRRRRRRPRGRDAGGRDLPDAGRVVAGRRRLDQRAARALRPPAAADRHQGAGHVLRAARPGGLRPGPLPGLDLDGRPVASTASRPTARRARRPPRTAAASRSTPRPRTFERDEAAFAPGRRRSWPRTCRAPSGPPIYTKTCLYTLTPDRDFVVDRLPERAGRRGRAWARPTASSSPRSSVASLAELARRRRDPVGPRARALPDRSPDPARGRPGDVLDGLDARGARVACAGPRPVPPYRHSIRMTRRSGEATDPDGGDFGCDFPARAAWPASSRPVGLTAALVAPRRGAGDGRDRPTIPSCCASARPRTSTR